jgi:hypothetical protein
MDNLISTLSEIRSQYNCLDEAEEPYYRALSEAIKMLSERKASNLLQDLPTSPLLVHKMPYAQPEQHEIGYSECANAMLKMWIDNVLTDGEYSRIMDKLNAHWEERREE